MKPRKHTLNWTSQALVGALLLPSAVLANETHVYGIAEFGGASSGLCEAKTHKVHTKSAAEFASYFTSLKNSGKWSDVRTLNNGSARANLWRDAALVSSPNGEDDRANAGVDDADVVFVHTHGGHNLSYNQSWLVMGSNVDGCSAITNHMRLGNTKLNIAVVKACQSGDFEVWKAGGYNGLAPTSSSFTVWNAFHGDSSCGNFVKRYVKRYVSQSRSTGVGENWIDEFYDRDVGKNNDDCPVSIVFGETEAKRLKMFESGGWTDRHNTGPKTRSSYYGVYECDPDNGMKLPSE
ncbi:hypothetical protein SAMN05443572_103111 [Myxococcus fulvus]|uniref:Uncharacterized protein n=1 Tax=Myxococcus fulvus TaxID=33 RepID=A0A511TE33_MYXFU|nr:hypothetical protein [Myxococcus fulvus]GEN12426.1 hypothetical protein MFU01_74630 [Myxococcus fulvus]SET76230.1 hypothetical protein SAMN05443572_103111 [Myxococcus fulvus]